MTTPHLTRDEIDALCKKLEDEPLVRAHATATVVLTRESADALRALAAERDALRKERDEAREQTRVGLPVGHGLMVYGTMEAIMRAQTFVLLDSKNTQEVKDTNHLLAQDLQSAEAKLSAALSQAAALREALTPSAETKAAYIGKFSFLQEALDGDGFEIMETITIPWTTIKEIMKAISARATLAAPEGGKER